MPRHRKPPMRILGIGCVFMLLASTNQVSQIAQKYVLQMNGYEIDHHIQDFPLLAPGAALSQPAEPTWVLPDATFESHVKFVSNYLRNTEDRVDGYMKGTNGGASFLGIQSSSRPPHIPRQIITNTNREPPIDCSCATRVDQNTHMACCQRRLASAMPMSRHALRHSLAASRFARRMAPRMGRRLGPSFPVAISAIMLPDDHVALADGVGRNRASQRELAMVGTQSTEGAVGAA